MKRDIAKPIVRRRVPSFRARRGVSITELTVSMVIVAATMAALAQLVSVAAQQRRVGEARRLAVQELANQAERVAALEWEEVAPGKLTGWTASDDLMQAAGGIATVAEVADEPGPPKCRRVRLEVSWTPPGSAQAATASLTVWKYPDGEAR